MNPLEKKVGASRAVSTFPNYTADGSYCFLSQCIFLNSLEEKDLVAAADPTKGISENYKALLQFMPLMNHEAKHWYDAHSTLWGLKLLREIYTCRNEFYKAEVAEIGVSLPNFYKQIELQDKIEYLRYPEYYLTRNSARNTSQPWMYDYSVGSLFTKHGKQSERPIFFTRFQNSSGELISRVPFSLCALLEASAVSQELNSKARILVNIKDPVTRKIESDLFARNTINELYNEHLVEYSVVAHKLANTFGLSNGLEAYGIAAKLTRFVLNITEDVMDLMKPEGLLASKFSPFVDAYSRAIKYRDHGGVFSFIVDALYSKYHINGDTVQSSNLEKKMNGLFEQEFDVTLKEVFSKSHQEVKSICSKGDFGMDQEFVEKRLTLGVKFHEKFGLIGTEFIDLDENIIPEFLLGDNTYFTQDESVFEEFEERYFGLTGYHDRLLSFSKACIA